MIQEEKSLLLKDLCARVPYHPKGHVVNACNGAECDEWLTCATFPMFTSTTNNCRLYIRPMSSMTEEEKTTYKNHIFGITTGIDAANFMIWVYKHHLDIFHFIEKGLALEAPKGMYNVKN